MEIDFSKVVGTMSQIQRNRVEIKTIKTLAQG